MRADHFIFSRLFRLLLACLLLSGGRQALAACSVSAGTTPAQINYGTFASQTVPAGGISLNGTGVDATFSVSCSVLLTLQLLSTTSWLRYTAQQPLTLSNGIDTIPYTLASSSTFNPVISASGQSIGGPTGFVLLGLALLSSGTINIPLHTSTSALSIWPNAGTYTGTQTLAVDGVMCTGLGLPGVCVGTSPVSGNVSVSLRLDVSKSCEFISSPALIDFGSVGFLENAVAAQISTVFRCTNKEDYLFYADNGDNYSGGSRRMTGPGGSIKYDILQPSSSSVILNSTNPLSRLGTGIAETVIMPIRITPNQATPAAGTYSDNVRMVIEY
ncbi:MAG TPA: spore coat protein U domain-containing protein [Cellvibrio sp.]|nr:spore coat protein U domain-containing protein [Cellvibrio sp.]